MGDYWDSYSLSDRKDEADGDIGSAKRGSGWGYTPPILPEQDDDPAPGDLFGRVQRIGRSDGLLGEFSSALEGVRARPGETGWGRHNLSEEILGGLMYPFGNRFGNEHARNIFKTSPAAFTYLSGEEAPPLPWGTYKGRGRDLEAARLAREQGRDLDSFTSRLQELESGQSCLPAGLPGNGKTQGSPLDPLTLAGQALSGVVGAIGDFFSPGEAHAETSADTGNVALEGAGSDENAYNSGSEFLSGDSANDRVDESRNGTPGDLAEGTPKIPNQIGARIPAGGGKITFAVEPFGTTGNQEKPMPPADESTPDQRSGVPAAALPAATVTETEQQQDGNNGITQSNVQEKKYREFTDEERDKLMDEAYKHHGMKWARGKEGKGSDGIDCSRLVGKASKSIGFDTGSPSSAELPNTNTGKMHFEKVDTPKKGDIVWFPGHVGFYDPNGEADGKPVYSATETGGVRHESYKAFGGNPIFYRMKILESNQ